MQRSLPKYKLEPTLRQLDGLLHPPVDGGRFRRECWTQCSSCSKSKECWIKFYPQSIVFYVCPPPCCWYASLSKLLLLHLGSEYYSPSPGCFAAGSKALFKLMGLGWGGAQNHVSWFWWIQSNSCNIIYLQIHIFIWKAILPQPTGFFTTI